MQDTKVRTTIVIACCKPVMQGKRSTKSREHRSADAALGEVARLTRSLHRATAFEADLQHLLGSACHQLRMALAAEALFCHKAQPAGDKSLS